MVQALLVLPYDDNECATYSLRLLPSSFPFSFSSLCLPPPLLRLSPLQDPAATWPFFAFGFFMFIIIVVRLIQQLHKLARDDPSSAESRAFRFLSVWTMVLWAVYPLLFVLVKTHVMDLNTETIIYVILDILAKCEYWYSYELALSCLPSRAFRCNANAPRFSSAFNSPCALFPPLLLSPSLPVQASSALFSSAPVRSLRVNLPPLPCSPWPPPASTLLCTGVLPSA